jgi:hypothetical protein
MPRKLKDIDVDEVSLVDAAANLTKFFIKKRRKPMDFTELLKGYVPDDEELTEENIAKAKGLSKEILTEITGALNTLNKYKDDMPSDVINAIKTLAKRSTYGYPPTEQKEVDFVEELETVEKAGARLSKATIEQLKKIAAIIQGMIGEREKGIKKDNDNIPDEIVSELEELRRFKKEKVEADAELEKKAQEDAEKKRDEKITELENEIKELKKKKGLRKSIEAQDNDGDGDDDGDDGSKWPSLQSEEE